MSELLKINYDTETPTVSARDLHEALGVASRFSRWFDSNKELFVEGEDYNKCTSSTVVNNGARRELEDYSLSVLMAKHICSTQIAKDYGISARKLNQILKDLKIQYKVGGQWVLYSKYQNNGYVHSRTIDITRIDGRPDVTMQTEWTQKGRLFLYEELKKHGYVPVIEQVA